MERLKRGLRVGVRVLCRPSDTSGYPWVPVGFVVVAGLLYSDDRHVGVRALSRLGSSKVAFTAPIQGGADQ